MNDKKTLYVLIGCDCDHDRKRFNKNVSDRELSWQGYLSVYDYFNQVRDAVYSKEGLQPALTLNIRADKHVHTFNGSYDYCFKLFEKHLSKKKSVIDEVAWHHHQFRLIKNRWVQECNDRNWIEGHIFESFEAIRHYKIKTLHTGWCFQNTTSMNAYNDVGIEFDYSALPGMRMQRGVCDRYDYLEVVNNKIYTPDRENYQSESSDKRNNILEIPATTVKCNLLNYMVFLNTFRKTRMIDMELLKQRSMYTQINVRPILYRYFISNMFKNFPDLKYYLTYFHADELLPDEYKSKDSRAMYSRANFLENIIFLVNAAKKENRSVQFVNVMEFMKIRNEEF